MKLWQLGDSECLIVGDEKCCHRVNKLNEGGTAAAWRCRYYFLFDVDTLTTLAGHILKEVSIHLSEYNDAGKLTRCKESRPRVRPGYSSADEAIINQLDCDE